MKRKVTNIFVKAVLLLTIAFWLSGCYEPEYYNHYGHHTRPWYEHHHREPPEGINFEIDVHKRHY